MDNAQKTLILWHLKGLTGSVTLKKDEIIKKVYFRAGQPVYVESSMRNELLGEHLLHEGKLTPEQLSSLLQLLKGSQKKIGELIVEQGILSSNDIFQALCTQMQSRFDSSFLLEDAEVVAAQGDEHLHGVQEFAIDAFRAIVSFLALDINLGKQPVLPDNTHVNLTDRGRAYLAKCKLTPQELKLTRLAEKKSSLSDIGDAGFDDPDQISTFLYILLGLKFVEILPQAATAPSSDKADGENQIPTTLPSQQEQSRTTVNISGEDNSKSQEQKPPIYQWALRLRQPLHKVFDASVNSSAALVDNILRRIVKELKLDQIDESYSLKDREVAYEVLNRLCLGAAIFKHEKRKLSYFNSQRDEPFDTSGPVFEAALRYEKAILLLTRNKFSNVLSLADEAIGLDPNNHEYLVFKAEVLMKQAGHNKDCYPSEILELLKKSLDLQPQSYLAFFHLGQYYKNCQQLEKARDAYNSAVSINSKFDRASAELRLINHRLATTNAEKRPLFGGLFQKKPSK